MLAHILPQTADSDSLLLTCLDAVVLAWQQYYGKRDWASRKIKMNRFFSMPYNVNLQTLNWSLFRFIRQLRWLSGCLVSSFYLFILSSREIKNLYQGFTINYNLVYLNIVHAVHSCNVKKKVWQSSIDSNTVCISGTYWNWAAEAHEF